MAGCLAAAASPLPFAISRARPLAWPEASVFYTAAVHGDDLTPAQRFMLERRHLNEMKERFRVEGRYEPPIFDRRLPSCLLLAREPTNGSIVATAGVELALVDLRRQFVLRRSRSEQLLRERLPAQRRAVDAVGAAAAESAGFGRRFHRPPVGEELEEELAALREQEAVLDDPEAAERLLALRDELAAAAAALPDTLRVTPLLSCVAVAPAFRRRGIARELCEEVLAEARTWRGPGDSLLAMVDEDNDEAAALLSAVGFERGALRDAGAVAARPERAAVHYDRRELEVLSVPMPRVGWERGL